LTSGYSLDTYRRPATHLIAVDVRLLI